MKCINVFDNENTISSLAKKINFPIKYWSIMNCDLDERVNLAKDEDFFIKMKKYAKKQEIECTENEIITWFDNMYLIDKIVKLLNQELNIKIIQELQIPFSNKRADYVLVSENKILIIEFSYNKFNKEYRYEQKLHQAIGYKELLQNVLSSNITIGTYTFINKPDDEDKYINEEEIQNLVNFINYYFKNVPKSAFQELEEINY